MQLLLRIGLAEDRDAFTSASVLVEEHPVIDQRPLLARLNRFSIALLRFGEHAKGLQSQSKTQQRTAPGVLVSQRYCKRLLRLLKTIQAVIGSSKVITRIVFPGIDLACPLKRIEGLTVVFANGKRHPQ